jgi:hypothetical protein
MVIGVMAQSSQYSRAAGWDHSARGAASLQVFTA